MMAILGLGRIQVKGEILDFLTRICHEDRWKLQRSRRTGVHSQCTD